MEATKTIGDLKFSGREIEFQALTFEGNLIKNIGDIQFFTDGQIIVNGEIPVRLLRQYAGLKDRNGKKIFEGDIVKYALTWDYQQGFSLDQSKRVFKDKPNASGPFTGEVMWDQEMAAFAIVPDSTRLSTTALLVEVIGNMYESHKDDIDTVGNCANCGVEFHIHKPNG